MMVMSLLGSKPFVIVITCAFTQDSINGEGFGRFGPGAGHLTGDWWGQAWPDAQEIEAGARVGRTGRQEGWMDTGSWVRWIHGPDQWEDWEDGAQEAGVCMREGSHGWEHQKEKTCSMLFK